MPRYSKNKFNKKYVRRSHNCYSYMLNKINKDYVKKCKAHMRKTKKKGCGFLKAQPGMYSGMKDVRFLKSYNCTHLCWGTNSSLMPPAGEPGCEVSREGGMTSRIGVSSLNKCSSKSLFLNLLSVTCHHVASYGQGSGSHR